jgi:hypothetical protein
VATADELIREAQYAFRNISHGSTNERKYRARAIKYAKRIIRKYPTSIEASQARMILRQLDEYVEIAPPPAMPPLTTPTESKAAIEFAKHHGANSGHTVNVSDSPTKFNTRFQNAAISEDWKNLLRRFMALPGGKKKFLGFILAIAIFFPGGIFAVSGFVIFYAFQPALLKNHLDQLLTKLGSE